MIREYIQISLSITTPKPKAKRNVKLKDYHIKPSILKHYTKLRMCVQLII